MASANRQSLGARNGGELPCVVGWARAWSTRSLARPDPGRGRQAKRLAKTTEVFPKFGSAINPLSDVSRTSPTVFRPASNNASLMVEFLWRFTSTYVGAITGSVKAIRDLRSATGKFFTVTHVPEEGE